MDLHWLALTLADPARQTVLVRLADGEGHTGLGEIALEGGWDDAATGRVRSLLGAAAARLAGLGSDSLNGALDATDEALAGDPLAPAVRCGVDVALHDLAGRRRGVAVAEVLGGRYRGEIDLSRRLEAAALGDGPAEAPGGALRIGYRPAPPREAKSFAAGSDIARLAALLGAFGDRIQIDVEAPFDNPALARNFAETLLQPAPRIALGLLQPLDAADLLGHATLRATLPIPVILDRSVRSSQAMAQIVRMGAADRIILGIERVGGLREAMRVVALGEAAAIGIAAASGAHTAVGAAAALALAGVLRDTFPAVLDRLEQGALAGGITGLAYSDGRVALPFGPGLGVTLPDDLAGRFQPLA